RSQRAGMADDIGHERFGLPAERPAIIAWQFRATPAFVDPYPRLLLGEGRRQLDCHDAALEADLDALPPGAGSLVGELETAADSAEIEAERAGAVYRDVAFNQCGRGTQQMARQIDDMAVDVQETIVARPQGRRHPVRPIRPKHKTVGTRFLRHHEIIPRATGVTGITPGSRAQ